MHEAGKYSNTELGDLLRWLQQIRDHDGCHSGGVSSPHAVVRILQSPASLRIYLKTSGCRKEALRVWLAMLNIVSGYDGR